MPLFSQRFDEVSPHDSGGSDRRRDDGDPFRDLLGHCMADLIDSYRVSGNLAHGCAREQGNGVRADAGCTGSNAVFGPKLHIVEQFVEKAKAQPNGHASEQDAAGHVANQDALRATEPASDQDGWNRAYGGAGPVEQSCVVLVAERVEDGVDDKQSAHKSE